jgi:hypothetical protein
MKTALIAAIFAASINAHRLDEYLQGTIISVEKNSLHAQMTLTPGVAIFPALLASIDTDGDGTISEKEQHAYAQQVLNDLSLQIDGEHLTPHLLALKFSSVEEMRDGRGEIQIEWGADLPAGGRNRKVVLENRHRSQIAAYQVNALVPRDPDIRITGQDRNYVQSKYQMTYQQAGVSTPWSSAAWLIAIPVLLFVRLAFLWRRFPQSRQV